MSYECFNILNNETIQNVIDFKIEMKSLLSKTASVSRNIAIYRMHRKMMLNEEHSMGWLQILIQKCSSNVLFLHMRLEIGQSRPFEPPDSHRKVMNMIHKECPEYTLPFNVKSFAALNVIEKIFVKCSRVLTYRQYMECSERSPKKFECYIVSLTNHYLYCWDYLYSINVIPNRHHVFDDEAMHSNTTQMCYLKYLIMECGLMVMHPRDIAIGSISDSDDAWGIEMWSTLKRMYKTFHGYFVSRTMLRREIQAFHQMNGLWILDIFRTLDVKKLDILFGENDDLRLLAVIIEQIQTQNVTQDIKVQVQEHFDAWSNRTSVDF